MNNTQNNRPNAQKDSFRRQKLEHNVMYSNDLKIKLFLIEVAEFTVLRFAWIALPFVRLKFGENAFGWVSAVLIAIASYLFLGGISSFLLLYALVSCLHGLYIVFRKYFFDEPWYSLSYGISIPFILVTLIEKEFNLIEKIKPNISIRDKRVLQLIEKLNLESLFFAIIDPLFFLAVINIFLDLRFDIFTQYFVWAAAVGMFLHEIILGFKDRMYILQVRDNKIRMDLIESVGSEEEEKLFESKEKGLRESTRKALIYVSQSSSNRVIPESLDEDVERLRKEQQI